QGHVSDLWAMPGFARPDATGTPRPRRRGPAPTARHRGSQRPYGDPHLYGDPRPPHPRRPASGQAPRPAPSRRRRRRLVVSLAFVAAALLSSGYLVLFPPGALAPDPSPTMTTVATPPATAARPTPSSTPEPEPTTPPLALPGDFPTDGPGEFRYARGTGDEIGSAGRLVRFRVAVETNIDEDPDEVARFVEATLGDRRGWTAGGGVRFQRVPGDAA